MGAVGRDGRLAAGEGLLVGPDELEGVPAFKVGQRGQSPVEGRQAAMVANRQGQQVGVGDLALSDDAAKRRPARRGRRNGVLPEDMAGDFADLPQQGRGLRRRTRIADDPAVTRHPQEPGLGHGAGGPAIVTVRFEPRVGVMDVIADRRQGPLRLGPASRPVPIV